jgi:hypothetical protein
MATRSTHHHVEVAVLPDVPARVTSDVLEVCVTAITLSGSIVGAGVTSDLLEVAVLPDVPARVTSDVLEVCLLDTTALGGGGGGGGMEGVRVSAWVS